MYMSKKKYQQLGETIQTYKEKLLAAENETKQFSDTTDKQKLLMTSTLELNVIEKLLFHSWISS